MALKNLVYVCGVYLSFSVCSVSVCVVTSVEKHSRPKPLKTEEEQLLRTFYEFKIQDVCDAFKFPRKIQVYGSAS